MCGRVRSQTSLHKQEHLTIKSISSSSGAFDHIVNIKMFNFSEQELSISTHKSVNMFFLTLTWIFRPTKLLLFFFFKYPTTWISCLDFATHKLNKQVYCVICVMKWPDLKWPEILGGKFHVKPSVSTRWVSKLLFSVLYLTVLFNMKFSVIQFIVHYTIQIAWPFFASIRSI